MIVLLLSNYYKEEGLVQTPYTYLIGWSRLNKWYYGCRYAKNCHPSDLWKTYFTSSNHVKKFRKDFGEPDVVEIRHKFTTPQRAKLWEETVLRKLRVDISDSWLNVRASSFNGIVMTDEIRHKISTSLTGKVQSAETKMKKSLALTGRVKSQSERNNISQAKQGKTNSETHKTNMSIGRLKLLASGWKYTPTEEVKQKLRKPKTRTDNYKYPKSETHKNNIAINNNMKIKCSCVSCQRVISANLLRKHYQLHKEPLK